MSPLTASSATSAALLGLALLGTCIISTAAESGSSPEVSISVDKWPSTTVDVTYGSTVILSCSVLEDSANNVTFEWDFPNGPCNTSSEEFIQRVFGNRLIVTVVDPRDEGLYNCTVTDDSGNITRSISYELSINGGVALYSVTSTGRAKSFIPSNGILLDTDLLEESGGKYRIDCRTAPGAAQWHFPDGSAVSGDSSADVYQQSHGSSGLTSLYISASSISDGTFAMGLYSCYAGSNIRGYTALYLNDSTKLRSQPLLDDVEVDSGVIVLKPRYYWDPTASYIACYVRSDWGIPLPPLCTQGNQSVVILSKADVGGTYEIDVRAVTGAGATGATAKALVVLRDDPLHLRVNPVRSTNITIEWTSNTQESEYEANLMGPIHVYINQPEDILTLKSLPEFTTFSFSFKPCANDGACSSITTYLTTLINNPTSVIASGSSNGTALLLSGSWSSVPSAVLYRVWWYLGAELIFTSTAEEATASVMLFNDSIQCNYHVVVAGVDEFGRTGENNTAEVILEVENPSAPPTPRAHALSDTEILVSWEPAMSSCVRPIASHQVRAAPIGTEDYTYCLLNTTAGPPYRAVCEGLSRGTSYGIFLIAIGLMGSTVSSSVSVTTFDVPDVPHDLRANAVSKSVVILTWQPPASDGGTPITHYIIVFELLDTQLNFTTNKTALQVSNLRKGGYYMISVQAVNAVGLSSSANSSVTTFDDPGPPTTLQFKTTPTSILLTWDPPSSSGGTPVTSYWVLYIGGGSLSHRSPSETSLTITGLHPETNYTIQVYARNSVGLSLPVIITVQTSVPPAHLPGLAIGAIAGIAVAVVVVLCLVLIPAAVGGYCIWKWKKQRKYTVGKYRRENNSSTDSLRSRTESQHSLDTQLSAADNDGSARSQVDVDETDKI